MDQTRILYAQKKVLIERNLEIIANNLANMNTAGFQEDFTIEEEGSASHNFQKLISYPKNSGESRQTHLGTIKPTNSRFDFALGAVNTYFAVEDPQGNRFYTRDGQATLSPEGVLVLAGNGYPLLNQNGNAIQLPQDSQNITVSLDGSLTVDNEPLGALGVFSIPANQVGKTEKVGLNLIKISDEGFQANEAETKEVLQGSYEGSNVRPTIMMTQLIQLQNANSEMQRMLEITNKQEQETAERMLVSV